MPSPFGPQEILPDAVVHEVRMPRRQSGNSSQGLAVTLMADYNLRHRAWLPAGAVVQLLTEFGQTPTAARTTINRLARRRVLDTDRRGRQALYRLTDPAAASLSAGGWRIAAFAAEAERWDGRWTLVAFRVPQEQDAQRRQLRGRLRWLGYAPLYDALWISPNPLSERAATVLTELSHGEMTAFRAEQTALPAARDPLAAWDVAAIAEQYEQFVRQWEPLRRRVAAGAVRGAEAVRARTAVMDSYRQFVGLDPPLPMRVMPAGWRREQARQLFTAVYDGLLEPALGHVRELAARHDQQPRPDILAHTVADLLADPAQPAVQGSGVEAGQGPVPT